MELSETFQNMDNRHDAISIQELFLTFRRHLGLFLSTILLITSLVTLVTFQIQPKYMATASVMIDAKGRNLMDFESMLTGNAPDAGTIETEVEVIKSRSLATKVVNKLNLLNDPEFNEQLARKGGFDKFKSWLVALFPNPALSSKPQITDKELFDNVVGEVLEELHVIREGKTYVLKVAFTSKSPRKAANVANAFAENYLLEQLETKFESASRTNDWLNERLDELRSEVRAAEQSVEVYRTNSGLLSSQGSSLTEQQISDLNAQQIVQTSEYNEVRTRLESVRAQVARGVPADSIAEVMASNIIRDLRRQESEVAGRRAELSSRYGPRHPEVLKVDRESADIQAQIRQEIDRIVSNLESEAEISRQKLQTIENGLSRLRSELSSNNRSFVRLRELEREAEASRTLYQNFLEQFKQNNDQEEITEADARVLSRAVIPEKQSSPNTIFNIIMGVLLGVFTGLGLVALVEMMDNRLSTGADVERDINIPFIASIPELNAGIVGLIKRLLGRQIVPVDYIIQNPLSMFAESFRTLRSTILLSSTNQTPRVITIASALPNEGKTTVVQSLGRMSALSGSKTVIVDCDLRLRQLSAGVDISPQAGIIKYLRGDAPLKSVIVKDEKSNCDYILSREDEYTNKDLLGSEKFSKLLAILRKRYDLVILDTAPVLMVAETRSIANQSDRVVVVARWRRTKADAVRRAVRILEKVDANIIGLVLTRVNFNKRVKYGAGDYSYYSKKYGNYYTTQSTVTEEP